MPRARPWPGPASRALQSVQDPGAGAVRVARRHQQMHLMRWR
jgi:hypothetical protein